MARCRGIGSPAGTNTNTNTNTMTTMSTPTTYAIAVLRNVYRPDIQGERTVRFVQEDGQNHPEEYRTYPSAQEALDAVDELDGEVYCTGNNEAGRPDYVVVKDTVADYITSGRWGDMSNYDWDECECANIDEDGNACGECSACIDMMIDQDIEYIHRNLIQ